MRKTLGTYLAYYVGPQAQIHYKDFNLAIKRNLTTVSAARAPKPAHIFRRACTQLSSQGVSIAKKENTKTFTSYVLTTDEGPLDLIVNKEDGSFSFDEEHQLTDVEYGYVESVMDFLYEWKDMLHEQPIREAIRLSVENSLEGLPMKPSGGLYFIPSVHSGDLLSIDTMYQEVSDADIILIPVEDSPRQRNQIAEALKRTYGPVVSELYATVQSLSTSLQDGTLAEATDLIEAGNKISETRDVLTTYVGIKIPFAAGLVSDLEEAEDSLNMAIASI